MNLKDIQEREVYNQLYELADLKYATCARVLFFYKVLEIIFNIIQCLQCHQDLTNFKRCLFMLKTRLHEITHTKNGITPPYHEILHGILILQCRMPCKRRI